MCPGIKLSADQHWNASSSACNTRKLCLHFVAILLLFATAVHSATVIGFSGNQILDSSEPYTLQVDSQVIDRDVLLVGSSSSAPALVVLQLLSNASVQIQTGTLLFRNVELANVSLRNIPLLSPLLPATSKQLVVPSVAPAAALLQFPWLDASNGGRVVLENVVLSTDCATYSSFATYVCRGGWTAFIQVNNKSIIVEKWTGTNMQLTNVSVSCDFGADENPLECASVSVTSSSTLVQALVSPVPSAPLLVVGVQANISFQTGTTWAAGNSSTAITAVLQGDLNRPTILDFALQFDIIKVGPTGLLVFRNLVLVNLPLGSSSNPIFRGLYLLAYYMLSLPTAMVGAPYFMVQESITVLPRDYMEYVDTWFAIATSSLQVNRDRASWLTPLFYTFSKSLTGMTICGPYNCWFNATLMSVAISPFPLMEPTTFITEFTDGGKLPLPAVYQVDSVESLLSSVYDAHSNSSNGQDMFSLVLSRNVSLNSGYLWPSEGVRLNKSAIIAKWGLSPVMLDFGLYTGAFDLSPNVTLRIQRVVLVNLPAWIGPAFQSLVAFASGIWAVSYNRLQPTTKLIVENAVAVVTCQELQVMEQHYAFLVLHDRKNATSAVFDPPTNNTKLNLPSLTFFYYEAMNITLDCTPNAAPETSLVDIPYPVLQETLMKAANINNASMTPLSEGQMLPAWWIATIVVVGMAALAVVAICAWLLFRVYRRRGHVLGGPSMTMVTIGDLETESPAAGKVTERATSASTKGALMADLSRTMVTMASERVVELKEFMQKGYYGQVYRGVWRGLDVAVKVLEVEDRDDQARQRAAREVELLVRLHHPNVVSIYGYELHETQLVRQSRPNLPDLVYYASPEEVSPEVEQRDSVQTPAWSLFIIQEYCDSGSLCRAIDTQLFQKDSAPNMVLVLLTATEIAQGMSHVHSKNILHGDLNPYNVVLQTPNQQSAARVWGGRVHPCAKIADFGLSIRLGSAKSHASNIDQGTPFYMAPEVTKDGRMNKAADVFSFGIILWELYYGTPPWRRSSLRRVINAANLLTHSPMCPQPYTDLILACVDDEPSRRPTFSECVLKLMKMLASFPGAIAQLVSVAAQLPTGRAGPSNTPHTPLPTPRSGTSRGGRPDQGGGAGGAGAGASDVSTMGADAGASGASAFSPRVGRTGGAGGVFGAGVGASGAGNGAGLSAQRVLDSADAGMSFAAMGGGGGASMPPGYGTQPLLIGVVGGSAEDDVVAGGSGGSRTASVAAAGGRDVGMASLLQGGNVGGGGVSGGSSNSGGNHSGGGGLLGSGRSRTHRQSSSNGRTRTPSDERSSHSEEPGVPEVSLVLGSE